MTQTGYQNIFFTEINPTSTSTAITMIYYNAQCCGATSFILGPVTILPNTLTKTTPTVTQPETVTVVPTVTVNSVPTTITKSSTSSGTLVQLSCEFVIAIPSLISFWLLVLSVSLALLFPLILPQGSLGATLIFTSNNKYLFTFAITTVSLSILIRLRSYIRWERVHNRNATERLCRS